MKALTVRQPFATLIALGIKPLENRCWRLPYAMLGQRVAIHAGLAWDKDAALEEIMRTSRDLDITGVARAVSITKECEARRGDVVAVVTLARCIETGDGDTMHYDIHRNSSRFAFVLEDVVVIPPGIACRGQQGFFALPVTVADRVLAHDVTALALRKAR